MSGNDESPKSKEETYRSQLQANNHRLQCFLNKIKHLEHQITELKVDSEEKIKSSNIVVSLNKKVNALEERVRKRDKALEKQNETIKKLTAEKQKIETSLYETKAKLEKKKLDKSTLKQDYHQLQVELNMAKESYQKTSTVTVWQSTVTRAYSGGGISDIHMYLEKEKNRLEQLLKATKERYEMQIKSKDDKINKLEAVKIELSCEIGQYKRLLDMADERLKSEEGNRDGNVGDNLVKPAAGISGVATGESIEKDAFKVEKKEFALSVKQQFVQYSTGGDETFKAESNPGGPEDEEVD